MLVEVSPKTLPSAMPPSGARSTPRCSMWAAWKVSEPKADCGMAGVSPTRSITSRRFMSISAWRVPHLSMTLRWPTCTSPLSPVAG
ncbi:hypothetical protein D9M68_560080 [compost metagenome]